MLFLPKILFLSKNGHLPTMFWLNFVRKVIFNRNFIRARFSFSSYLRCANRWEPGSGTI